MFENRQEAVEAMMNENIEFRRLYNKHQDLDRQVHNAEAGVTPMDDFELVKLKKEKLWAKDRLAGMLHHSTA